MAKLGLACDREHARAREPQRRLGAAAHAVHEPGLVLAAAHRQRLRVRQRIAAGAASRSGRRRSRASRRCRPRRRPSRSSTSSRQAERPRARPEPGDRAPRPRRPQDRAVEPDSRSPGGKGFTGLEALLQYVFNQTLAINTFGPFGHMLAVDAFVEPEVLAVRDAGHDRREPQDSTAPPTGSATRGSGPTSPASTRPTRRTRAPACPTRAARRRARPGPDDRVQVPG